MARYLYTGPPTAVALRGKKEIRLAPGMEVDADDSPYFKRLLAKGLLKTVPPGKPKAQQQAAKDKEGK